MNPMIEVHILQQSRQPALQILFNIDLLLIYRLNLNQLELILTGQQKRKSEKIEIRIFLYILPEGLHRIYHSPDYLTVKLSNRNSLLLLIAQIEQSEVFAGKHRFTPQLLSDSLRNAGFVCDGLVIPFKATHVFRVSFA